MYKLSYLVIECTRRCNMRCDHCLRGDPEDINMNLKYVDKLFKKIDYISTITLSGGEPSLVPDILIGIIKLAKKHNVEINSFYIATNGKLVSDGFIRSLFEWHMFCDNDDGVNKVEISQDYMHKCDYEIGQRNIDKLMCLRFVGVRNDNDDYNSGQELIHEGRAAWNYAAKRHITPSSITMNDEDGDEDMIEDDLYLDCNGDIHSACDLSYFTMDEGNFKIGNIMDDGFDFEKAIETYNNKLKEAETCPT